MSYQNYYEAISTMMETVVREEAKHIETASAWCVDALLSGGLIHVFGTGHSHMLAEEMFYRAGGLLPVNPILDSDLMLHIDAPKSSRMERLTGLADVMIESEPVRAGDVMFVFSNSGRNAVSIEMAAAARKRGLKVIGVTSLAHSKSVNSRQPGDLKLYEVVDLVIDNHGVPGDAVVPIANAPIKTAATSGVIGTFIVQAIVSEVVTRMAEDGQRPPVFMSSNVDGAEAYNAKTIETYKEHMARMKISW